MSNRHRRVEEEEEEERRTSQQHGATDNDPQGHQGRRRKRPRAELQNDLDEARRQAFESAEAETRLKQQVTEQEAEIRRLRQLQRQEAGRGETHSPTAGAGAGEQSPSDADIEAARAVGRRCALLHTPWLQGNSLFQSDVVNEFKSIISDTEAERSAISDEDQSTPEREWPDSALDFWRTDRFSVAGPVDIVRELMAHMDLKLAKRWLEPWFRKELKFRTGHRKIRSDTVLQIANHRGVIFGMSDDLFGQRGHERKRLAGAKDLLDGDKYLWEKSDDSNKTEFERFFRSHCLLQSTKLLLLGPSSVNEEQRSTQAGMSRADQYELKHITPSILSFIAISVHFVLSGDKAFDKVTPTANYVELYEANLRLLKAHRQRRRREYNEMIATYNQAIFPDFCKSNNEEEPEMAGMTSGRKSFYEKLLCSD
ncbi:unnamed protein product, partial [Rhizoctonia solani]